MAVGFRSSSIRGVSDAETNSVDIPVPAGASEDDIVICFVGRWLGDMAGATITPADLGFSLITETSFGNTWVHAYWKRLSESDSGDYSFSWTGDGEWSNGSAVCITGALTSGDPVAGFDIGSNFGTSYPDTSVTTASEPFLAWGAYNESADTTHDVPDGFTGITAQDYGTTAYLIPGTTGTHTATGATANASMELAVILVAIAPETTGPEVHTLSATARLTLDATAGQTKTAGVSAAANIGLSATASEAKTGRVAAAAPLTLGSAAGVAKTARMAAQASIDLSAAVVVTGGQEIIARPGGTLTASHAPAATLTASDEPASTLRGEAR